MEALLFQASGGLEKDLHPSEGAKFKWINWNKNKWKDAEEAWRRGRRSEERSDQEVELEHDQRTEVEDAGAEGDSDHGRRLRPTARLHGQCWFTSRFYKALVWSHIVFVNKKVATVLEFILTILTFINWKFWLIKIPTITFATLFYYFYRNYRCQIRA